MRTMALLILTLFILGFITVILLGSSTQSSEVLSPKPFADLDPKTFHQLIQDEDKRIVLLDIRTPEEYAHGYLAQATLMDFYANDFKSKLEQLDKDPTYLLYCRSGNRSRQALNLMEQLGFKDAHHLAGGILRWTAEGYPVERAVNSSN